VCEESTTSPPSPNLKKKRCLTCRHWERNLYLEKHQPDMYAGTGTCTKIDEISGKAFLDHTYGAVNEPHFVTHETFGCVLHKSQKKAKTNVEG
jgi:hypothetical protein